MIDFLVATLDQAPVLHAYFTRRVRSPQSDRCELETLRPFFSSLRKETLAKAQSEFTDQKQDKRKYNVVLKEKYYSKKNITAEKEEECRDHFAFAFCSDFVFRTTEYSTWHVVLQISVFIAAGEVSYFGGTISALVLSKSIFCSEILEEYANYD